MYNKLIVILISFSFLIINASTPINELKIIEKNQNFSNHEHDYLLNSSKNSLSDFRNYFIKNCGQLKNDNVQFYGQDGSIWFTNDSVWFELSIERFEIKNAIEYDRLIIKKEFIGANSKKPIGKNHLSWNSNFFYSNNSNKWCTGVPNYAEVWYENVYDGIDLRYYMNMNGLKYDLIVHPGADPNQIII